MGLYLGLISGTSADAVDAALAEFGFASMRVLACHSQPLPEDFRRRILHLSQTHDPVAPAQLAELDVEAGQVFADAALALLRHHRIQSTQVDAIGSHGQTLYHNPGGRWPYTWQIGDPNVIAQRTGITTVADFRRRDLAAGGQGAPLVPAFHQARFRHPAETRVVLNIGGIANITVLPADPARPVSGYDTGPGNALLDAWCQRHLGQAQDTGGAWAASAPPLPELVRNLLQDPYFHLPPPKSSGRDYFNLNWLDKTLAGTAYPPPAVQASLAQLTVDSVADAVRPHAPRRLLVCGGGVHNPVLMAGLSAALPECAVESTAAHGVEPDWVEALCFAWLARQRLEQRPGNLPSVTGASQALVLGGVYSALSF